MGRFAESDPCDGFIREIFLNVCNNCDAEQIKSFAELDSDEKRFCFMSSLECRKAFNVERNTGSLKNYALALSFKKKGNDQFQSKEWMTAVDFYNKSLLVLPSEFEQDFSILLANRSAALYHMQKYDLALQDIELAEKNYPVEMLHKLKERSARCHLAKKNLERALKSFQETVTNLDRSTLPMEKRGKLEKDAQIMIKMLTRQLETEKKMKAPTPSEAQTANASVVKDKCSKALVFDYTENEGRFAKADRPIKAGEQILCEKAHCATLSKKFAKSHCQNCFQRTITPIPCPNCIDIVFCSRTCRDGGLAYYHRFECGILETIWKSGSSINALMALRIITQRPLEYFKNLRPELTEDLTYEKVKHLPSDDYRRVYGLIRHEDKRDDKSYFQNAFMATFLIDLLRAAGYFELDENIEDSATFIGTLILRNLQFLQFNSHEIFDLLKRKRDNSTQTISIGAGLYPTLALFNHSCNPSIVRYFKNTSVCVHAIQNVQAGDAVAENYGPLYSQNTKSDRQINLKKAYWFDCSCEACEQNWPVYADMNTDEIRFKCNATKDCKNVIAIPTDCNEFMIRCIQCGEYTNILKGLKAVQDTEILDKSGKRLFGEGKIEKALAKYLEMMNIFDDVMAPPFQDYCKCQQALRDCFLEFGNRIQLD